MDEDGEYRDEAAVMGGGMELKVRSRGIRTGEKKRGGQCLLPIAYACSAPLGGALVAGTFVTAAAEARLP